MSNFDSDPLTSDPALFPAENIPNSAKSNHIFRGKRRGDRALILKVLDSSIRFSHLSSYSSFKLI